MLHFFFLATLAFWLNGNIHLFISESVRESTSTMISCNYFVLKGKTEIKCLSTTYYLIKIVEIVNTVLSPIYPLSEWGICLFFFSGLYLPPHKNAGPDLAPPIKMGLESPLEKAELWHNFQSRSSPMSYK